MHFRYEKGAEVVRMYETLFGREGFRMGMDVYFARHDGSAVTCDDFLSAMADANGADLSQFALWYSRAGTPTLTCTAAYDRRSREYTLTLTQTSGNDAPPLLIPVVVGALDSGSKREALPSCTLLLSERSQTFTLGPVPHDVTRLVPSVLRGFSAPVRLVHSPPLADDDLALLIEADTDAFNRWEAAQALAMRVLQRAVDGAADEPVPDTFARAFDSLARGAADGGATVDHALLAEAMSLPALAELADALRSEPTNPLKLVSARHRVKRALARHSAASLEETYRSLGRSVSHAYSSDARESGRRALRNTCLDYLNRSGPIPIDCSLRQR